MDNQLKNLRESMNNTVLKRGTIDDVEKRKILNAAFSGEVREQRNYFAPIMTAIVITGFFLTLGSFVFNNIFELKQNSGGNPKLQESGLEKEKNEQLSITKKSPEDTDKVEKNIDENTVNDQPNYHYIVLNDFYYKKTNEEVTSDQLGEQVGEVKRIGDWAIKKSGDTNEIPPGPIFSIKGRSDEYIAGKGVVYKNGKNMAGYLVFQKADKVKESNTDNILSTKGDGEEANIVFQNIKRKIGNLYGFMDINSRVSLEAISYSEGPVIQLNYQVPEGDKKSDNDIIQGFLLIYQYKKDIQLKNSRFEKQVGLGYEMVRGENGKVSMQKSESDITWENPILIESFSLNGIEWGVYQDSYYHDLVIKGQTGEYNIEITTQGDFTINRIKDLLRFYKEEAE
jgi:hypothetical protein